MFRPTIGGPAMSADQAARITQVTQNEVPIAYSAGNTETTAVRRGIPLTAIWVRLSGSVTFSAGSVVLHPFGMLNLIKRLQLIADGDQQIVDIPGEFLPTLNQVYNRSAPVETQPGLTAATHAFNGVYKIPLDVGGYISALDASRASTLELSVQWGTAADMVASGGGTITLSNVKLNVMSVGVAGIRAGQPGGLDYPYLRHIINGFQHDVLATDANKALMLTKHKSYSGFILHAYNNGTLSDAVVNSVGLKVGNNLWRNVTRETLRGMNVADYNVDTPANWAGIHVLPVGHHEHIEHMVNIRAGDDLYLMLDQAAGTNAKVNILRDYFISPQQG